MQKVISRGAGQHCKHPSFYLQTLGFYPRRLESPLQTRLLVYKSKNLKAVQETQGTAPINFTKFCTSKPRVFDLKKKEACFKVEKKAKKNELCFPRLLETEAVKYSSFQRHSLGSAYR